MRRTTALLLALGCGDSQGFPEGLRCGEGMSCPPGQLCDVDDYCRFVPLDGPPGGGDPDAPGSAVDGEPPAADADLRARCGDGDLRAGVEQCDDGNQIDGDGCSALCLTCTLGAQSLTLPSNHHCYWRVDTGRDWLGARADCAAAGGHLATLQSPEEDQVVAMLNPGVAYNPWFGLNDRGMPGMMGWVTGEPVTYTNWSTGEPNNSGNCVLALADGRWSDMSCAETHRYLCEDGGWVIGPDNHAYKLITDDHIYNDAVTACAALGGHLATITSQAEHDFVEANVALQNVWLGATDRATEGSFAWVTGEPFTFTAWDTAEPDGGSGQNCLLSVGAAWQSTDCGVMRLSLCEIH